MTIQQDTNLPTPAQLHAVWRHDAGPGTAWTCPDCGAQFTLGGNAAHHAMEFQHAVPQLEPYTAPEPARPMAGCRVGDFMQVAEDLRLALEIAEAAVGCAARAGAPLEERTRLLRMVRDLRGKELPAGEQHHRCR